MTELEWLKSMKDKRPQIANADAINREISLRMIDELIGLVEGINEIAEQWTLEPPHATQEQTMMWRVANLGDIQLDYLVQVKKWYLEADKNEG
jgi:hypothetical protein